MPFIGCNLLGFNFFAKYIIVTAHITFSAKKIYKLLICDIYERNSCECNCDAR
ncbi:hypothetical protein RhiirA4_209006 [Rhizophagus irregularis]|uniref:Uncharacterized protein n=1 Tax=Rhizophagus irregularis TaxID=588596 RepID=A0A2I1GLB3_9GLOM|nr:hypothetical protein RhiirA4_209006 [Rhizophagus irregularis]